VKIGLVGKPNVGKSTFYAAATMAEAEIANYPFTTIEANRGMAYVRVPDPGPEFGVTSTPRTGKVVGATRYVPVEVVDVAGLVPGAHEGRGLGNRFLTDLSRADALIHVVDAAGATDAEGNPIDAGSHDPVEDVRFLERELDAWIEGMLADGWEKMVRRVQQENRKLEVALAERLSGIGVGDAEALRALKDAGYAGFKASDLPADAQGAGQLALRRATKPMIVALNKADLVAEAELAALESRVADAASAAGTSGVAGVVRVSAQAELALARGAQSGALEYAPGAANFTVKAQLSPQQEKGLGYIRHALARLGSTGVHQALEMAAFGLLGLIPVFPVEDDHHYTDKEGRVLPDCHLVPQGTTAKQLALRVHTDLGEHFIRAVDARSKRVIGADHELQAGDVVRIVADA
jgi:ribosome-binding ATPase